MQGLNWTSDKHDSVEGDIPSKYKFFPCRHLKCTRWVTGANGQMFPDDEDFWGVNIHDKEALRVWLENYEDYENWTIFPIFYMFIGRESIMYDLGASEFLIESIMEAIHYDFHGDEDYHCFDDDCEMCGWKQPWLCHTPDL